ncbi:hypothetical protein Q7P37_002761 [Cladosporium fusiforme]
MAHLVPTRRRPILTTTTTNPQPFDLDYSYLDEVSDFVNAKSLTHPHNHFFHHHHHHPDLAFADPLSLHQHHNSRLPSAHRYRHALDSRHDYLHSLMNSDISSTTVWTGFGPSKHAILGVTVPKIAAVPLAVRGGQKASMGYRTPAERAHSIMMEPAIETAPSSPPELSYSKSSKSSSSSCRSLSLDGTSTEKLASFEDITLEENERNSVEDCNQKPESRPTLKRPPRTTENLDVAKRNGATRYSEPNGNARGPSSLQVTQPMGRGMRRGFTSPSSSNFPRRHSSRSPSPNKGLMSSPLSPDVNTPKVSHESGLFARRSSWQPGKKTTKELEAEYDDLDEEVPDEAILENVPFTPIPGQPRVSRSPSPQRQPSYSNLQPIGAHTSLHSANVPKNAKRPHGPLSRSPRSPKHPRPKMPQSNATVSSFPPEPFGRPQRSKSWTDDLNEEARQLSAKLEEYAERRSGDKMRSAPGSASNSPPRTSIQRSRTAGNLAEMPPVQKGNIMIDPLPISKEKEAVLTRTRPSWLPPKCQKEEKKHMKQWEQMMARAAEVEKKRASKEKTALENKTELEGNIARIWEQHVLPNWDHVIHEPRTRELWWRGVTPAARGLVWPKAIGNDLSLSTSSYTAALTRVQQIEARLDTLPAEERAKSKEAAWLDAIARDVPAVFPDLGIFNCSPPSPAQQNLSNVLKAYAMYRSDVGYVYGTHLIAGLLCLHISTAEPATAFVALANLLNRPTPLAFLVHDQTAMSRTYDLVLSTLKYKSPTLHAHLTSPSLDISPSELLDPLFRCLFAYNLPHTHAARVWDLYVFEGDKALVRSAVAVLAKLEPKLYGAREEVLDLLGWGFEGRWELDSEEDFVNSVREAGKVDTRKNSA